MGTPSLVVEILSPSSRSLDMIKKLNTYMLSGVNEYWMADPDNKTVIVYIFKDRKIENFITYKMMRSYHPGYSTAWLPLCLRYLISLNFIEIPNHYSQNFYNNILAPAFEKRADYLNYYS